MISDGVLRTTPAPKPWATAALLTAAMMEFAKLTSGEAAARLCACGMARYVS
jgi:hypothetical protein